MAEVLQTLQTDVQGWFSGQCSLWTADSKADAIENAVTTQVSCLYFSCTINQFCPHLNLFSTNCANFHDAYTRFTLMRRVEPDLLNSLKVVFILVLASFSSSNNKTRQTYWGTLLQPTTDSNKNNWRKYCCSLQNIFKWRKILYIWHFHLTAGTFHNLLGYIHKRRVLNNPKKAVHIYKAY